MSKSFIGCRTAKKRMEVTIQLKMDKKKVLLDPLMCPTLEIKKRVTQKFEKITNKRSPKGEVKQKYLV